MQPTQYRRRVLQRAVICLPTFDRPDGICDFVFQTARELSDENVVIILALGENWRGVSGIRRWWQAVRHLSSSTHGRTTIGIFQFIPFQRFAFTRQMNLQLNLFLLNLIGLFRYRSRQKILWIFHPFEAVVLPFFMRAKWHLHADVVDWHTSGNNDRQRQIDRMRAELLQRAHSITVISEEVRRRVAKTSDRDCELVPQGFDAAELTRDERDPRVAERLKKRRRKTTHLVGYFGGINQRLDFDLLEKAVTQKKNYCFLFVGPVSEDDSVASDDNYLERRRALLHAENVVHLPSLPRKSLLPILKYCDALIIPYDVTSEFNRCSFPMKVMEYLVAERPIVSVDLPSLRKIPQIALASSAANFIQLLDRAVTHPLSSAEKAVARSAAFAHTWKAKIDSVDGYLARVIRSS